MVQENPVYLLRFWASLTPDEGTLSRPQGWTVAHMAQEVKALDLPAIDFVLSGDEEYWEHSTTTTTS